MSLRCQRAAQEGLYNVPHIEATRLRATWLADAPRRVVEEIIDALIAVTTVPQTGNTGALDATGQRAWTTRKG